MTYRRIGILVVVLGAATVLHFLAYDWIWAGKSPGFRSMFQLAGMGVGAVVFISGLWLVRSRTISALRAGRITTIATSMVFAVAMLGLALPPLTWLERGAGFEHDLTAGMANLRIRTVRNAGISGMRMCRCTSTTDTRIRVSGDFEIPISIFDRGGSGPRPGIVIVHGNTWRGRALSTYRLLATFLAREGYIVATFDKVGFGESDDPFGRGPEGVRAAYDTALQTEEVVRYLIANTPVDPARIALIGHSAGVEDALRAGSRFPGVSAVVAMVAPSPPGSGDEERKSRISYLDRRFEETYKFVYGKPIPAWYRWELTGIDQRSPENPWMLFREDDHPPILVVLGERDAPAWHASVEDEYQRLSEPKQFFLLSRSDHYANTSQTVGLVLFDKAVATDLVQGISQWLSSTTSTGATRSLATE